MLCPRGRRDLAPNPRGHRAFAQEGWERIVEAFDDEKLRAVEGAVDRIYDLSEFSPSDGVRLQASSKIAEALHPDFQKETRVTVSGDRRNPIRVETASVVFTADLLDRPVEEQVRVLELAEEAVRKGRIQKGEGGDE